MGKIRLENMVFYAYHGVHEEEKKLGNKYSIDVELEALTQKAEQEDNLIHTIDYTQVYDMIKRLMGEKFNLLEHIAHRIQQSLERCYDDKLLFVRVKVNKHGPPIGGVCDKVSFELEKKIN